MAIEGKGMGLGLGMGTAKEAAAIFPKRRHGLSP
jgi:hypothetical protein